MKTPDLYHVTPVSSNKKTGPVTVTTSHCRTCPAACPLRGDGPHGPNRGPCYGNFGPLSLHWRKVSDGLRGLPWESFLEAVKTAAAASGWVRWWQAGDWPHFYGRIVASKIYGAAAVVASVGARQWCYTHHAVISNGTATAADLTHNRATLDKAAYHGLVVNLSADSMAEVDRQHTVCNLDHSTRTEFHFGLTVTVPAGARPTSTPGGLPVQTCPAAAGDVANCLECRLCANGRRAVHGLPLVIAFPGHGTGRAMIT